MSKTLRATAIASGLALLAGCEASSDPPSIVVDAPTTTTATDTTSATTPYDEPTETLGQTNARRAAESYLEYSGFSREGLVGQLEFEGYTTDDAIYGADNAGANWMHEAAESAESYLEYSEFSREGLAGQLEYEGFTAEQIDHALTAVGYGEGDQNASDATSAVAPYDEPTETLGQTNARRAAESYLEYSGFSREGLVGQLEFEGYTTDDAIYGADNAGADWMHEAAESAESYLEYSEFSREGLAGQLEYEGFTAEQIDHALTAVGF